MNGLMAHAGSAGATRAEVEAVETPRPTASWQPIPHNRLLDLVQDSLTGLGLEVATQKYALGRDGKRFFGVMGLKGANTEYALAVGLRNSHDMSIPAGLALGSSVFVCDNLAFSGEVTFGRRHTRFIERDLPRLVADATARLIDMRGAQDRRIEAYKNHNVQDGTAHDVVIRALDAGVICATKLPDVLREWRLPRHEAFAPRNAWSLFNGFTEVLKAANPLDLPRRTQRLHGLVDNLCGLAAN